MSDFSNVLPPNIQQISSLPGSGAEKRKELGQEQFFELMVAQLQNQDPLKPLESNEFLSQVAQFSTVSGIGEMQQSIASLASSLQSGQALQASVLVGSDVLVPGTTATLETGGALKGSVEMTASSSLVRLDIVDAAGQTVRQLDLGPQSAGQVRFSWDGLKGDGSTAVPGVYQVRASALVDGSNQAMGTLIQQRVESVTLDSSPSGLTLNLKDLGPVSMADVREVL